MGDIFAKKVTQCAILTGTLGPDGSLQCAHRCPENDGEQLGDFGTPNRRQLIALHNFFISTEH